PTENRLEYLDRRVDPDYDSLRLLASARRREKEPRVALLLRPDEAQSLVPRFRPTPERSRHFPETGRSIHRALEVFRPTYSERGIATANGLLEPPGGTRGSLRGRFAFGRPHAHSVLRSEDNQPRPQVPKVLCAQDAR